MNELALFSGAGGGILGSHLMGWRTVCAVEWADYPRRVLLARQRDEILPKFPIWDDVQTFDGKPWRGRVDIVTGGFPCQDISAAGKGAGIDGERSGMWRHMARIIGEIQPRYAFVENSPMLTSRGLGRVLGDLAEMGYNAKWGVLGAHDVGAPHKRDRIWILAHSTSKRLETKRSELQTKRTFGDDKVANTNESQCEGTGLPSRVNQEHTIALPYCSWWRQDPADKAKPELGRMANGVAHCVDRLKAIGNGQVPAVVRLAFETLIR